MTLLILGVILWSAVHLFRGLAPAPRDRLAAAHETRYKSVFSLLVIGSLVLIVFGWRAAEPSFVYTEPDWGRVVNMALMLVALILFFSGRVKTNIKRVIRHPQLTGVLLWSVGHLLSNGDSRSVFLFAALGLWAVIEIVLINRRVGPWQKPDPVPVGRDLVPVVIGAVAYGILGWAHPYFTGVSIY